MTFQDYDEKRSAFVNYPNPGNSIVYPALAFTGEAGEVANEVKKYIRDDHHRLTDDRKKKILLEMGDALWYLSALAFEMGSSLNDVARMNLEKLTQRKEA